MMQKYLMLIFGCFLLIDGINAVLTGVVTSKIGPGMVTPSHIINYQERPISFIVELIVQFSLGGWFIFAAIKSNNKKE